MIITYYQARQMRLERKRRTNSWVTNVPRGTVYCPKCGGDDYVVTSAYYDTDYYCTDCAVWFTRDAEPPDGTGDAMERLG